MYEIDAIALLKVLDEIQSHACVKTLGSE